MSRDTQDKDEYVKSSINGKDVIIIDDMVDACGTLYFASRKLKDAGARKIYACITHGIFSGQANNSTFEALNNSCLDKVIVTNTICQDEHMANCSKIQRIDVSRTFAEAIAKAVYYNKNI